MSRYKRRLGPIGLLTHAPGHGKYSLAIYAPVTFSPRVGYEFERMAVVSGRLAFVRMALDQLDEFRTHEDTERIKVMLEQSGQSGVVS